MKITMVGTFPPIKGISRTYCVPLSEALSRHVEVDFVSFSHIYPEKLYPGGTKELDDAWADPASERLSVRRPLAWFNPLTWLWTGLTVPGRLLHIHWWTYFLSPVELTLLAAAKLRGTSVIMTVHNVLGHETNMLDRMLSRLAFSFPDRFIVHTEQNRRQLHDVFGVHPSRVAVIPFGALTVYDDAPLSREEARAALDLDADERVLLHFGYIRDYKGLDVLLRAMPRVIDAVPGVKLVVAGTCWQGERGWRKYQQIIDEGGLGDRVKLDIGYVPSSRVKVYFRAADLVVLPYLHFEAQSGPGNIGLAFGSPMIVTHTGGLPSLVRDADAVVPPGDAAALAEAIIRVVNDPGKLAKMSRDSVELAREYSWPAIAERTVALYDTLLSGRGHDDA
ncbi:MAG TPA: glycosyltransferase [Planctomycetota bacterium]|nr:glycosyltransferase [Planctomycetota bacterium]